MPGEGTGTPAASGSTATLATLRDRVRILVENAFGAPDPLVVAMSTLTLADIRDRVEATLVDASNAIWTTGTLDEAIKKALENYSRDNPRTLVGSVEVQTTGREVDISGLTGLLQVLRVWWNYNSGEPGYPPAWKQFQVWPGPVLFIEDEDIPQNADTVRVWYTAAHTIQDLDAAQATTLPANDIGYIITGAAGFAAQARAVDLIEQATLNPDAVKSLNAWADDQLKNFRAGVNKQAPAWQRYQYAHAQEDIHEALRWALHRYSQAQPDTVIATLILDASGRELDISSLTDLLTVAKVWLPYDASEPERVRWRSFEQWPDDILFISDGYEPDAGDVARIWYTRLHALNGLDSATTTTIAPSVETLLVVGAAGYTVQQRIQEQQQLQVSAKLREWVDQKLREFEDGIRRIRRRPAGGFVTWQPARRRRVPRS